MVAAGVMCYLFLANEGSRFNAMAYFFMFFGSIIYHTFMPICR